MRRLTRTLAAGIAVAALAAGAAGAAMAADFPTRPISWVVPYTPGGITDTGSRVVADQWSRILGQPVVVENKPGAGGTVGTEFVARAEPDGYTVIYATQGTMAASPWLQSGLRYDPLKDFVPIHSFAASHNIILAAKSAPFKTIPELVEYAKANPGKVNFGSAGVGTSTHLSMELFKTVAGIEGLHIPYKGSAPAMNDLLAGRIDVLFDYAVSSKPHVEAGTVVAIATNAPDRHPAFPELSTLAELGYPDATSGSWSSIAAPAGTPPEVIEILARTFGEALATPEVTEYLDRVGSRKYDLATEELAEYWQEQSAVWKDVIERAGIAPK